MSEIDKIKILLKSEIEKAINENTGMTPDIAKKEIIAIFNKIDQFKNIEDDIECKRNEDDKNIIDISLTGNAAKLYIHATQEEMKYFQNVETNANSKYINIGFSKIKSISNDRGRSG